jgi:low molecular weight protein-tyrosine phosphatase
MRPEAQQRSRGPFKAVLVCTGNRFRSPLGEALLRKLGAGLPLSIQSLGTRDVGAVPVLPQAQEAASQYGVTLTAHRTRSLGEERLGDADLVLGFERAHVTRAVIDGGALRERTFTLPEIVVVLQWVQSPPALGTAEGARHVVMQANRLRMRLQPDSLPEIADPFKGNHRGYTKVATEVESLCRELLRGLFGANSIEPRRGSRVGVRVIRAFGARN